MRDVVPNHIIKSIDIHVQNTQMSTLVGLYKLMVWLKFWLYFEATNSECQISERLYNHKYKSRGFETLRDLTIRRLIGYWNWALYPLLAVVLHSDWYCLQQCRNSYLQRAITVSLHDRLKSPANCLFNSSLGLISTKKSGLYSWRASKAENVSMAWCSHVCDNSQPVVSPRD